MNEQGKILVSALSLYHLMLLNPSKPFLSCKAPPHLKYQGTTAREKTNPAELNNAQRPINARRNANPRRDAATEETCGGMQESVEQVQECKI